MGGGREGGELEKYEEGVIVCWGCLGGEVGGGMRGGEFEEGEEGMGW